MRAVTCSFLPMAEAVELHRQGVFLEQNLFGALALERAGLEMTYLAPHHEALQRLSRLARSRLGDLDQEWQTVRARPELIYAGSEDACTGLALLRRTRILRTPLVGVFHSPPASNGFARRAALGYDVAVALSRFTRDRLLELGRDPERTVAAAWGPQLDHPAYRRTTTREEVVSAGKSGRDIDLLAAALDGHPATIYAPADWTPPSSAITVRPVRGVVPHGTVLADLARATVVAIPYRATDVMLGLTELNDALALAKPVVMTRSPHIDVDIEAVGCGIWVDPGDLGGWRRALTRLREHPDEAQAMGAAGRRFAQESWNAQTFERDVRAAVRPLVPDL